jgi:hypothetical protein
VRENLGGYVKDNSFNRIPIRVCPHLEKGAIFIIDRNGPKPIVYVENESMLDLMYRAISSDAEFSKRCGVIVNLGDLPE